MRSKNCYHFFLTDGIFSGYAQPIKSHLEICALWQSSAFNCGNWREIAAGCATGLVVSAQALPWPVPTRQTAVSLRGTAKAPFSHLHPPCRPDLQRHSVIRRGHATGSVDL